ncbi:DUF4785 domain-containing protein [Dyella ginsengisoli]|uniref:DUF4785 domain-containing protein n=1 Tax=Dyella ginsengisoli TaxID=363848 RepID=UPI001F516244|nr:DUF4785 domain-containing protein [Dyella ginsengisoli]
MNRRILAAGVLAGLFATSAFAGTHALLPATPTDMVPVALQAAPAPMPATAATLAGVDIPRPHAEHRPVSVSWALPADAPVNPVPQPFARTSREYWTDVSATEMQRGVELPLSAPGAVIRISPSDPKGGRLDASAVTFRMNGQTLAGDRAASTVGDVASLRAAGMAVPDASLVMQLRPGLGAGPVTLQAPNASGRYVVHVFEPKSPFTVTARADRDDLLLGQRLHLDVAMKDGDRQRPLQAVGGFLRAPDGSTTLLDYHANADGSFSTDVAPVQPSRTPGLWELHSFTIGDDGQGHAVRRDTTSVFAVATPDAKLDGTADTRRAGRHGIDVALGVTVDSASRFAVSGVLYGRDAQGRLVPGAFAQSAAWLKPGERRLVLRFDPSSIAGIGAPYELRDLRLQDQPAISLVERRALALRFDRP